MLMARGGGFARLLPCVSACVPLHIDEGSPRHSTSPWLVCRRAFPAPSRHTGGVRQVLEPFLPPPPATPAVRDRVMTGGFGLVVGTAFIPTPFLRVFLAP